MTNRGGTIPISWRDLEALDDLIEGDTELAHPLDEVLGVPPVAQVVGVDHEVRQVGLHAAELVHRVVVEHPAVGLARPSSMNHSRMS